MNYYEQPRNRQGRWVRGYSKIKLVLWFGGVVLSVSLVAYIYDTFAKANTIVDEYISEPIICEVCNENKTLESKIAELKSQLLADLAKCESNGNDGVVVIDSNDYLSWGRYQWQRKSIQHYAKLLYGKDMDLREAGLLALDAHEISLDEFTSRVIWEANGIANWKNCDKKLGLKGRIDIINQLSK